MMLHFYLKNSGLIATVILLLLAFMYLSYKLGGNNWSSVKRTMLRFVGVMAALIMGMIFFFIGLAIYFNRTGASG